MEKLTLRIDSIIYNNFEEYLLQLKGVCEISVDRDQGIVSIIYDTNKVNLDILIREIKFCLEIKIPSIICFEKYSSESLLEYEIIIKDLCCEYCLKGQIEELLIMDGIKAVNTDYNYNKKDNVKICIKYDDKLLSQEELINIDKKFNCED